ncbi:hypothetical protein J8L88_10575 [Aquimarina sp. MMG015]|uniref:hypothetical protein n=1 Tax=Aquimarina sp. MMG015 TaxID=2822689 RepID=UPI001B3A58EE|nr:hypothetical protein [Aquimarina sp. MMG015]MBQ4803293.1 hypothetical protein [Aquimarina sp. MMG015]
MAIKDYINVFYSFENNNGFSINTGNSFDIRINPQLDMTFDRVICSLQYQVIGKAISNKSKISSLTIDQNGSWKKKNNYNYAGKFELGDLPPSYNGKNLQIIWWLYLEVEFKEESKSRIQNLLLKDVFIFSLIKSFDGKHQNKNVVSLTNPNYEYAINNFDKVYKIDPYLYFIIGVFIMIITMILYFGDILKKYFWIPAIAGIGIAGYGQYKINSIGLLKEIRFKGTHIDNEKFNLEIAILKNEKKISSAKIRYKIIEEVIDDRGTTSTTYKENIYNSETKSINQPVAKVLSIELQYPSRNIPIDFSRTNVRFYSQIEISFQFKNNTSGVIKQVFPLTKIS